MGDCPGTTASQVVKVRTVDGAETVVEPGFVEACSNVKKKVEEAGPCGEVIFDVPDVHLEVLQEAIKYWESSKADTFDGATYLGTLAGERLKDFVNLSTGANRLGYDLLFEEWAKEFRRQLHRGSPSVEEREKMVIPESWFRAARGLDL